ncbi:MAG: S8 family peptidase [Bacillota bacterium]
MKIRKYLLLLLLFNLFMIASLPAVSADFTVPGERNQVNLNKLPLHTAVYSPEKYIIKFKNTISKVEVKEIFQDKIKVVEKISNSTFKIQIDLDYLQDIIKIIKSNVLIEYMEPDYLVHIQEFTGSPDDTHYSLQWNLQMLNLEEIWQTTRGDNNITVAVIDTGIIMEHPDLTDKLVEGYDFVDNDSEPIDTDTTFSHGTHVAGIIGAMTNNQEGIAGVNWNVKIMPVRVIGAGGSGGYSALISGIYWAVDNGADIINLSLAGSAHSESLREAIQYAIKHNVTVVAAAGNNGTTPVLYPAIYPEVISVGAVGPTGEKAYYSNYGPNLDLVAPGGDNSVLEPNNTIYSTAGYYENHQQVPDYSWSQGTSMATPHVSGLIALLYTDELREKAANLPEQIASLLKSTADDLGDKGFDNMYGAGLINIGRALSQLSTLKLEENSIDIKQSDTEFKTPPETETDLEENNTQAMQVKQQAAVFLENQNLIELDASVLTEIKYKK